MKRLCLIEGKETLGVYLDELVFVILHRNAVVALFVSLSVLSFIVLFMYFVVIFISSSHIVLYYCHK